MCTSTERLNFRLQDGNGVSQLSQGAAAGHTLLILDTTVARYSDYLKGNDCHLSTHWYLRGAWRVPAALEPICLISQ